MDLGPARPGCGVRNPAAPAVKAGTQATSSREARSAASIPASETVNRRFPDHQRPADDSSGLFHLEPCQEVLPHMQVPGGICAHSPCSGASSRRPSRPISQITGEETPIAGYACVYWLIWDQRPRVMRYLPERPGQSGRLIDWADPF
jgi:hypothetical protein